MTEISKEISPSKEIVQDLMSWLYISKMRSPYLRANLERVSERSIDIMNKYKGYKPNENEKRELKNYVKNLSKEAHLNWFSDIQQAKELVRLHVETLNTKHWRILKSLPKFPFWTNDNPGFSPNVHPLFAKDTPFHQVMELNSNSIIFYVLSPKYCVEITSFKEGTPCTICALNMEIKFEQASPVLIDYINKGVFYSRYKLLISNSKKLLEDCVRTNN